MLRFIILCSAISGSSLLLYFGLFGNKESDARRVFSTDEVVWYGLDFTKAHCVGTFDQGMGADPADGIELRDKWIPAWNNLVIAEPQNFNLKRSFRKRHVYYDLASVSQLNKTIDPEELLNYKETKIGIGTIRGMVKKYSNYEKVDGIGLVFVIENFNKNTKTAGLYVTFFDLATKKVLISEFMSGNPVGFGLRNYWAGAIKDILVWIDFYEFNKWKDKYYNKPPEEEPDNAVSKLQNAKADFF